MHDLLARIANALEDIAENRREYLDFVRAQEKRIAARDEASLEHADISRLLNLEAIAEYRRRHGQAMGQQATEKGGA